MKLADFAEARGKKLDTIGQYIRRHAEQFKGHTWTEGNVLHLDDEGERLLNEKYPLPRPVEIVEDVETIKELSETRKALAASQAMVAELQRELMKQQSQVAQLEATQMLLEDRENMLREERAERKAAEEKTLEALLSVKEKELEIQKLRNRNFWERIMNK